MKISIRYTPPKIRDYVIGFVGALGVAVSLRLALAMPPESMMLLGVSTLAVGWLALRIMRMGRLTFDAKGMHGGRILGRIFELKATDVDDLGYTPGALTLRTGGQLHQLDRVWPLRRAVRLWLWWWHRDLPDSAFADLAHPPIEARIATRHVRPGSDGKPWTDAGVIIEDGSERVYLPHHILDGDAPVGMPPLAFIPLNGLITAISALTPADRRLHLRRLVRELYGSVFGPDSLVETTANWRAELTPGTTQPAP